jgi:hypothetical protein
MKFKIKIFIFIFLLVTDLWSGVLPPIGVIGDTEYYVPPPMVLVHGLNSDPLIWSKSVKFLSNYFLNSDSSEKYSYNSSFQTSLNAYDGSGSYTLYPFSPTFDYSNTTTSNGVPTNGGLFSTWLTNNIFSSSGPYNSSFSGLDESGNSWFGGKNNFLEKFCPRWERGLDNLKSH